MKKVIEFFIKRPITIIMVVILMLAGGIIGTMNMPLKLIPDINIPMISVTVIYPGASASTVEETVTTKIDEQLSSVSGVTAVTTYSYDNISAVMLSFDFGTEVETKITEVNTKLDALELPSQCETPDVSTVDLNADAVATIYVTDSRDATAGNSVQYASDVATEFAGKLSAISGVGSVELDGEPTDSISITPFVGLEQTSLLLVQALSVGEYDLPLGDITEDGKTVQVRNLSGVEDLDDIRALPVTLPAQIVSTLSQAKMLLVAYPTLTAEQLSATVGFTISNDLLDFIQSATFPTSGDMTVAISDIAKVIGPGDENYSPNYEAYAFYNGVQGIKVSVYTASGANGTAVVSDVKKVIKDMTETEGATCTIVLTDDQSEFITDSVSNVLWSMLIGGVLAVIVLFLFLRKIKLSIIISVTMPLSVISALLLLFVMGITLNMVSLGGLAVGIGMLVDNSIVVIESIYKRRDAGDNPFKAAINGTAEVAGALLGSTLTTVCVFIPILFVGGLCAEIFTDLAWAVIWSLSFSLLVAIAVIPTLYCLFDGGRKYFLGGRIFDKPEVTATPKTEAEPITAAPEQSIEKETCAYHDAVIVDDGDDELLPVYVLDEGETIAQPIVQPVISPITAAPEAMPEPAAAIKPKAKKGNILSRLYARILPSMIKHKVIVIIVAILMFAASVLLVFTSGTEFLPSVDKGLIEVQLDYYGTATLENAEADADELSDLIKDKIENVDSISVSVGVQGLLAFNNTGIIGIKLDGKAKDTSEVAEDIRKLTADARAEGKLTHTSTASVTPIDGVVESLTGGMSDLSITILGDDIDKLKNISDATVEKLKSEEYSAKGFKTVSSTINVDNTATEYDIDFDLTVLASYGIDYSTVVQTLRVGLAGYTAATAEIDEKVCDVTVKFDKSSVASGAELSGFVIGVDSATNTTITLGDVATITPVTVDTMIEKTDGKYTVYISAEVYKLDSGTASELMEKAAKDALSGIDAESGKSYYDLGYDFNTSGVASYLNDAFKGLIIALIISFFLLFAVMAAQFESISKPLIIMCAIPFSFSGGFIALAITRVTLNVVSFVGIIMLMGVIVNNAIVMLEKIKQLNTEENYTQYDAVVEGCKTRLRPILMTTLTTVLALIPLAIGIGKGSELMQPLGIVVIGGLLLGTLVTLVLIPAIYCLVKGISKKHPNGRKKKTVPADEQNN